MEEMNLNNIVETGYEAAKKSKGGIVGKVVCGVGAVLLAGAAGVYAYKKRKGNEVEDEGCEETEDEE